MEYRVYVAVMDAKVRGERVHLFRVVVERRDADHLPWEPWDTSYLYDSVEDVNRELENLRELYQSSEPPEMVEEFFDGEQY